MRLSRFFKAALVLTATLLVALLLLHEAAAAVRTVKLMQNFGRAAAFIVDGTGLQEREWTGELKGAPVQARLYGSAGGAAGGTAIVFVPGLSSQGIANPRFVSTAQALARSGYYVLAPDIESFKRLRLDPAAVDEIGYWFRRLREDQTLRPGKVGILGVSVAGTFSLLAASDRDAVDPDFIVSVGGYQDLLHCLENWFRDASAVHQHGDYPVQKYGKWITMLEALDRVEDSSDRRQLAGMLRGMLETGRRPKPPAGLSEQGERWFRLAVADSEDSALYREIRDTVSSRFHSLNPDDAVLSQVRSRVFLVHGSDDELVPSSQTLQLERRLTSARTSVLITPIISHTHPQMERLGTFRRYSEYVRAAWFLYSFVRES
jgi:pimeloyl-ACP methyl ester carboxylesterase